MEKDTRNALIIIVVAIAILCSVFVGIGLKSGLDHPQTTVNSQSMQHGVGSQLGIIDTGDIFILKSSDRVDIRSFVDGYKEGFTSFGDYGHVIIYERGGNQNPVIHRAILWLDYNGDHTWSAPSLKDYPAALWSNGSNIDYMSLSGVLVMRNMGYNNNVSCSIDLDRLANNAPSSGYITMGDNNLVFDQSGGVIGSLVSKDIIKSVAWIEIPWLGSINMIFSGKSAVINEQVPNSIPCIAVVFLTIIFGLAGLFCFWNYRDIVKYRKELTEEKNAPTPLFPLEKK
jgi:hypothetical protein